MKYQPYKRLLLVLLVVILYTAASQGCSKSSTLMLGDPVPRIVLDDLAGGKMTIPDSIRGRAAVVHFWTEGCSACTREMPAFQSLYDEYRSKGFVVVAVNVGQQREGVNAFVRKIGVSYPALLDPEGAAAKHYGVSSVPQTFFLDREGRIKYKILGEASEKSLNKLVMKIL